MNNAASREVSPGFKVEPFTIRQETNCCQRLTRQCLKVAEQCYDYPIKLLENGQVAYISYEICSMSILYALKIGDNTYPIGELKVETNGEEIVNQLLAMLKTHDLEAQFTDYRYVSGCIFEWKKAIKASRITDKFGYIITDCSDHLGDLIVTFNEAFKIVDARLIEGKSDSTMHFGNIVTLSHEATQEIEETIRDCLPKYTDFDPNSALNRIKNMTDRLPFGL